MALLPYPTQDPLQALREGPTKQTGRREVGPGPSQALSSPSSNQLSPS